MKSADTIKKGLEVHSNFGSCADDCPYDAPTKCGYSCSHTLTADSLTLIQQYESNWQRVSNALCGKENATLEEVLQGASQVKAELAAVKRERDALLFDLSRRTDVCAVCEHGRFQKHDCKEIFEVYGCRFEWRGVCPENTEVQDNA